MSKEQQDRVCSADLKRLKFLVTATESAASVGIAAFEAAKKHAPVANFIAAAEKRCEPFAPVLAPYATRAVDIGMAALKQADEKVDQNLKLFNESKDAAYKQLIALADAAIEKLKSEKLVSSVQAARDTLIAALSKAKEATDPDVAFKLAHDAWTAFVSFAPVRTILETAEPATKASVSLFVSFHDRLVSSPHYKSLINQAATTINPYATYAASTLAFKSMYPIVKPMSDKFSNSKVAQGFVSYWAPQVAC